MPAPQFGAVVAEQYERWMVPMLFTPYAHDLVKRIAAYQPQRLLEIACGTGAVTRELAAALPSTAIVATDLNTAMIERAATIVTGRAIEWQVADAQQLPFPDASFDVVACQFGAMFFPDKVKAYGEMRRVLRPGGHVVFSTWTGTANNDFDAIVETVAQEVFPADPPNFMSRIPHGYFDEDQIRAQLVAAGFAEPRMETVTLRSRCETAEAPARAISAGTPLRNEIEARDPAMLERIIATAAERIAKRFGTGAIDGPVEGKMQALVVEVAR